MQAQTTITTVNTIAERLKQTRESLGLSQEQLAAAAKVSQGTIGNVESGLRKNPRELLSIAKALGVRPEWLKDGVGQMAESLSDLRPLSESTPYTVDLSSDTKIVRAPVVEWARLGTDLYKDFSEVESLSEIPVYGGASRQVKWYVVDTDMPRFRIKRGHKVAIDPYGCSIESCEEDELYLFKTVSGKFFLAEFRSMGDGEFEATPDNGQPMDSVRHKIELVAKHLGTWK